MSGDLIEFEVDEIHEHCGVVGVYDIPDAAFLTKIGLHALQHRGHEGGGIVSRTNKGKFHSYKNLGLISNIISDEVLKSLKGRYAIGHNRYSTVGGFSNFQPFMRRKVALGHNGQIANYEKFRKDRWKEKFPFTLMNLEPDSDSRVILDRFIGSRASTIEDKLRDTFEPLSPSYSAVIQTKNELVGIRDPFGVRPLSWAQVNGGYAIASESTALYAMGAESFSDIGPGQAFIVDKNGPRTEQIFPRAKNLAQCIFELIYFAHPNSELFGLGAENWQIRYEFGKQLYYENVVTDCNINNALVVPVLDSGVDAAEGYAHASGMKMKNAIRRSHYVGRTFIDPTQDGRNYKVRTKFSFSRKAVQGKEIVLIDDSIVRGTTMKALIKELKRAGASKVHVRIASPQYQCPCNLGVDTPDIEKLIAHKYNIEGIRNFIGADSLAYLSEHGLFDNQYLRDRKDDFCRYCFNHNYPFDLK